MIAGIVNNDADGTVTIIMNDDAHTEYTFRKASTAASFAILNAGTLGIIPNGTSMVRFAVNPSNAYISTNIADWRLYDVNTGATPAHFTLEGIAPDGAKAGQYMATIRCNAPASTVAALKLNAGTAAAPAWISSSAFEISIAPKITMTTNKSGNVEIRLAGSETATINWGDGTAPEIVTLTSTLKIIPHTWADGATTHSISIYGLNITQLRCHGIQLSSLDVTKNTVLTTLRCDSNQLTLLDVSKNTALTSLHCDDNRLPSLDVTNNTALAILNCQNNQLTAEGLNALFVTLHSNYTGWETIYIKDNPGFDYCDKTIAEAKGWEVN